MYLDSPYSTVDDSAKRLHSQLRLWRIVGCLGIVLSIILSISLTVLRVGADPVCQAELQRTQSQLETSLQKRISLGHVETELSEVRAQLKACLARDGISLTKPVSVDLNGCGVSTFLLTVNNSSPNNITSLDLSNNNVTSFSDQSLPSLESLDLRDNPLRTFSRNYFPSLTTLNLSESVESFTNNNLSALNGSWSLNLPSLSTFSNNTFQNLYELYLYNVSNLRVFEGNNFPTIVFLLIYNFQSLQTFQFRAQNMVNLQLHQGDNISLSSLSLPQLRSLSLFLINCSSFSDNYFPNLKQVFMYTVQTITPAGVFGGARSRLESVHLVMVIVQGDIVGFNLAKLAQLRLDNAFGFQKFEGNVFPSLQTLVISRSDISSFKNNSLSSIDYMQIEQSQIRQFNMSFPSLKRILLTNNALLVNFSVSVCSAQSFNFTDNHLLTELPNLLCPNLTDLNVIACGLKKLGKIEAPNLTKFDLFRNNLGDDAVTLLLEGNFPKLQYIRLEINNITKRDEARSQLQKKYPTASILV